MEKQQQRFPKTSTFLGWREQNQVFEQIGKFIYGTGFETLRGVGGAERVVCQYFDSNVFQLLGVEAMLGRTFLPEDFVPGLGFLQSYPIVISHGFWQRRFGGNPNVIGQTLRRSDGSEGLVVGVMPPGFRIVPWQNDVDICFPVEPTTKPPDARWLATIARLKPGVAIEQATAELEVIARRLEPAEPATDTRWSVMVEPLHDTISNPWVYFEYVETLYLLLCRFSRKWRGSVLR